MNLHFISSLSFIFIKAQDIQETHETKGQDNPNHGPNSSKDSVQLFGSNSTSNIFEKIQSSKKENSSTLTNLIQAKSSISNPFLQYSTYVIFSFFHFLLFD